MYLSVAGDWAPAAQALQEIGEEHGADQGSVCAIEPVDGQLMATTPVTALERRHLRRVAPQESIRFPGFRAAKGCWPSIAICSEIPKGPSHFSLLASKEK